MDSIENITRSDALYMLQGSALSSPAAGQGGSAVRNGYGLSPGGMRQGSQLLACTTAEYNHVTFI